MKAKPVKYNSRLEVRIAAEQKSYYEKAADLGGYRSLTEFAIAALQEKAKEIINEKEAILKSEKDAKIFFDAIMNPPKPNKYLKEGFKKYKKLLSKK
jgi:uncharacterized protein (DUF1778 family)